MAGSKTQIVFIHGGSAYSRHEDFLEVLRTRPLRYLPGDPPKRRFTDTLSEDLGAEFEVFKLSMPNAENARYSEWKIWFERYVPLLHDGVVLVGWSLGGYFLLKYLSEQAVPVAVRCLELLAAPYKMTEFGAEDGADFVFDPATLAVVADRVGEVSLWHSEDDFVVPYQHAIALQAAIPGATLKTFTDRNHFLVDTFPELLQKLQLYR